MSSDELGDVRGHPVEDRVGDEHPAEVVEGVAQRPAVWPDDSDLHKRMVEVFPQGSLGDGLVLEPAAALEQQRHRRVVDPFVLVVGDDQRDATLDVADPADNRGERVGKLG